MSLRKTIFLRINLLIVLLITAICVAGSALEIKHRQHDTRQAIETRVGVLAEAIGPLIEQDARNHITRMLQRLDDFHPSVKMAFIAKENEVFLTPSAMEFSMAFPGSWSPPDGEILSREFEDENGIKYFDVVARVGHNTLFSLHAVMEKSAMGIHASPIVKIIFGFGLLGILFSIPLSWWFANTTTHEVDLLTRELKRHNDHMEDLVQERTTALKRFKHIVSVTIDHMSFIDTNYTYREINESYLMAFGKTRKEIVGYSITEIHGAEVFHEKIKDNFDKCLGGESIAYQAWFPFPESGRRFMDVSYVPFKETDGTISGVVVSGRDITESMVAADRLGASEKRFHALFNGLGIGVAIYKATDDGQDFIFLDYNQAGQTMDGVSHKEAIGRKVSEVFPGVEEFGMMDVLRRVWQSGVPEEHPVSIYKDQTITFWRHNSVFKLPSGEIVAVYTDETERMQVQENLRSQHNRFVTVLDSLDAIVYVADMETHEILFANKQLRDQFKNCTGKTCWQAIQTGQTGPCDFCTNDRLLDEHGSPTEPLIWEFQNTADRQWYQCRDQAIHWPDGRLVRLEIATNITDRKQSEEISRLQGKFLKSLANAAQALLTSAELVPYQDFLDIVGPASNAGSAFIFLTKNSPQGDLLLDRKGRWYSNPEGAAKDEVLLQDRAYDDCLPNWYGTLNTGLVITTTADVCPEPERQLLLDQNIQTVLIIPIMIDSRFFGFIGFDNCISGITWSPMEQTYLEAAAFDLAQAIKRSRSEKLVRESLKEKEDLLREIHHRVKNNMQVVTSLLNLQARKITDQEALKAIRESQDRIQVMSLVHETLYRSDDLHSISMKEYFTRLAHDIIKLYPGSVQCRITADDVTLSINDAIPVGLIANELVTNAFKHAFPDGRKGEIQIRLGKMDNDELELVVSDNGVGIADSIDLQKSKTLGLQLVSRLAEGQLGGTLEVVRENGSAFHVRFASQGV